MAGFACVAAAQTEPRTTGPDVIVGDLIGISNYGQVTGIYGYSVGTTSCNIGTQNLLWVASTNQHPVIGQNMFRLQRFANGVSRFEQIGQSWLKHGFTALTQNLCNTCSGVGGSVLGVGCSDPYSSGLNGQQSNLGPKSEVNASNGNYPYPYVIGWNQTGNAIYKRLQVAAADLNPTLPENAGALYFVSGQYIAPDDANFLHDDDLNPSTPGVPNGWNNESYRRVVVANNATYTVSFSNTVGSRTGATVRRKASIYAWPEYGGGVNLAADPDAAIPDTTVIVQRLVIPEASGPAGLIFVAYRVTDLGNGTWDYEYAIQNYNSHRSASSWSIPVDAAVTLTNMGFRDVNYHSGEPYANTDWTMANSGGQVSWTSPQTFAQNPNTNALRWGTMYNFRFQANQPPVLGTASLGIFRPAAGQPNSVNVQVLLPQVPPPPACPADWDGNGELEPLDITAFFADYRAGEADFDGNGETEPVDISSFFAAYRTGC